MGPKHKLPRHWQPFTTRTPWFMFVGLAVIGCVVAIELALRTKIGPSSSDSAVQLGRRQDHVSGSSTTSDEIERITINEDLSETSQTYADTEDFLTITSISDTESSSTYEPPTITGTSALPEDFLTLTTSSAGAAITSVPRTASVLATITVPNTDPTATPSILQVLPTVMTVTSAGTTAVLTTATTVPVKAEPTAGTVKSTQVQLSETFTGLHYTLATYLGVILAVVLKLTWTLSFSGLKMMEPFYQLAKPGGATAKESLSADYLTPSYGLTQLRHLFSGHWAMLFSTVVCIAIGILGPLSSEIMAIVALQLCPTSTGKSQACKPVWVINTPAARAVEAILLIIALLILLIIFFNFRRPSGVFSDPTSIATIAALLSHHSIRQDMSGVDQSSSDEKILKKLEGKRYALEHIPHVSGRHQYGLVNIRSSNAASPYEAHSLIAKEGYITSTYSVNEPRSPPTRATKAFAQWKRMVRDVCFTGVMLALFSTVLGYYLVGGNNAFNNFFNSKTFGPRFLLTTAATVVDFEWKTVEREVRIMAPYRQLGRGNASPERSVLANIGAVHTSSFVGALKHREYFRAVVAVTAILSDILIIAVSGVPLADAQIMDAFRYSSWVSMVILAWMMLVMLAIFRWRMQLKKLKMPREPNTILAVCLMLTDKGNGVVEEYWDSALVSAAQRDGEARRRGNRYYGGWQQLEDGSERWCVGVRTGMSSGVERY